MARSYRVRGAETVLFEYDRTWLADLDRFLSAMAMMSAKDGDRASYPEIVDALVQRGAQGKTNAHALYRRVVFNVLISNVDDHLRNHGFLWFSKAGWSLSPADDLNPTPTDLKARVLTTNIDLDEGACSLDLLEKASEYYALTLAQARAIVKEVAAVTAAWRDTARAVGARPAETTKMASAFEHAHQGRHHRSCNLRNRRCRHSASATCGFLDSSATLEAVAGSSGTVVPLT